MTKATAHQAMIKSIHPPHWYVGMRDETLQLLIEHEEGFSFLDVNLRGCKAGRIILSADINGKAVTFPYELRERQRKGKERMGFTPADTLYLLMPDRFGGSLNKIRKHLDYLADLGITAIWMTPVVESSSYHGYDTTDYFSIKKKLGTMVDYQALVNEAHSKGLKVIMDFVFNHCGIKHPWVKNKPEDNWINHPDGNVLTNYRLTPVIDPYAADIDRRKTIEGWFVKTMPDLNLRNPRLLRYFTQCTMWWIETADIDGIRMDTFPYAEQEQMEQWLKELHNEYPHFHVVGETWVCNSAFTARMQQGELDSSMDFALQEAFGYARHEETTEWWSGLNRIYHVLCYDYLYRSPAMTMAFLDNHDTNRYLGNNADVTSVARLKIALALLLTIPRIPQIYYGTEILMTGTNADGDTNVRKPFPDGTHGTPDAFTSTGRTAQQNNMYRFLRRLLQWRRQCPAIHHGSTRQFMPYNGIYVIARTTDTCRVLTIVNGTGKNVTFQPEHYAEVLTPPSQGAFTNGTDIITGRTIRFNKPFRLSPYHVIVCQL